MARSGVLEEVPATLADELRRLLRDVVVAPAVEAYPHLSARLQLA